MVDYRARKKSPLARLLSQARALSLHGQPLTEPILRALDEALPLRDLRSKPRNPRTEHLPWPRNAEDGTPLGVDLSKTRPAKSLRPNEKAPRRTAYQELRPLIVSSGLRVDGQEVDDIINEVAMVISRRNHMPCAFDPRKSTFGHYVHMIARNACINMSASRKRGDELTEDGDVEPLREDLGEQLLARRELIEDLIENEPERAARLLAAIDKALLETAP